MTQVKKANIDAVEDGVLILHVGGEDWVISPEPDKMMRYFRMLSALRDACRREAMSDDDLNAAVTSLLRETFLEPFADKYRKLGPIKKLAVLNKLAAAFIGEGAVESDPTPGTGSAGCIAPPDSASTPSKRSTAKRSAPSTRRSAKKNGAKRSTSSGSSPRRKATTRRS